MRAGTLGSFLLARRMAWTLPSCAGLGRDVAGGRDAGGEGAAGREAQRGVRAARQAVWDTSMVGLERVRPNVCHWGVRKALALQRADVLT